MPLPCVHGCDARLGAIGSAVIRLDTAGTAVFPVRPGGHPHHGQHDLLQPTLGRRRRASLEECRASCWTRSRRWSRRRDLGVRIHPRQRLRSGDGRSARIGPRGQFGRGGLLERIGHFGKGGHIGGSRGQRRSWWRLDDGRSFGRGWKHRERRHRRLGRGRQRGRRGGGVRRTGRQRWGRGRGRRRVERRVVHRCKFGDTAGRRRLRGVTG